jgi:flagellar M-ring protein FliF
MPAKLRQILQQFTAFWAKLPTAKRLALIGVTVGVLAIGSLIALVGTRDHFAPLYTDLATQDAAAIVQKLDSQQIPHRLDANGTTILVPEERVHTLRLELASAGLPKGTGVGFEIFDRSQIGATEFEQQVNLRRALEGELARSIMTVDGVKGARVHLVLPEHRLFAVREESASASVVLKLSNPDAFGKREVAAVVHLVAAAVPGLSHDRVSVVSTEGVTLHRPVSDTTQGGGEMADLREEQARTVASQLENDVRDQLERVVGPGNADVRVNVTLDAAARERTEEHYDQDKVALRSEHKVEELTAGASEAGVAGVPGARSNLPDAPADSAQAKDDRNSAPPGPGNGVIRRSDTRNWEVDRVTEKTTTPAGGIGRLSVAVLLNGKYEKNGKASVFVARTPDEVAALDQIVKSAVGFDATRGDVVELKSAEFARPTVESEEPAKAPPPYRRYLPYAAAALAGLFLLSIVVLSWRRGKTKKKSAALALARATQVHPLPAGMDAPKAALPESVPGEVIDYRARALELALKDPATAAVVIRKWLNNAAALPTSARS